MSEVAPQLARADLERLLVHADWLHALARRLVGGAAADDVVQETLIAAMRSPPDAERPPRPWLGRVLRNVARMRHRGDARRTRREDTVAVEHAPAGDSPADAVQRLQTHRALCDVVLDLDEPYRSTLVMHYYDGRTLAEIARAAGVPEATVRWRHRHALDLIRARLDERSGGDRRTWLAALAPLAGPESIAVLKGLAVKKILAAVAAIAVALLATWQLTRRSSPEPVAVPAVEEVAPTTRLSFHRSARTDGAGAGRIHGRIHGPAGAVRATLIDGDGAGVAERSADGERVFDFTDVKPGTYCVVVAAAAPGLGASACEITVRAGDVIERDLELAVRGARLTGVISDSGGGPIAGALVVAQRRPGGSAATAVRSDATGAYALSLAPGYYDLAASADGYARVLHALEVRAQERLDLRLHPGSTIAGRVLDPDGKPAVGATVTAGGRDATAGADGRFTVDGLAAGRFDVVATLGELAALREAVAIGFGASSEVELVLAATRSAITGRVVDGDGRPLAGARIDAEGPVTRSATSAADGRFRIGGLVLGAYDVGAIAADFVRGQSAAVVGPDDATAIELKLMRGVTVRGIVRTASGEPVAGAEVASSAANLRDARLDVTTDASGAFRIGPLPTGQVRLSAHHREHGVTEIVQLEVPGGSSPSTELVFRAAGSIAGVVRQDDGTPAAGAQVEITPTDTPARWAITADRDGRFAINALPAGMYMIEARPLLATPKQETVSTKSNAQVELEGGAKKTVELEVPGGREHVRGRVVDDAGRPIAGAAVWAERIWDGVMSPVQEVRAYSSTDGAFDLEDLPRGTYSIYARHVDGRTGQADGVAAGATSVSVVARAGARVTGRVVDREGRPVRSFRLQWNFLTRQTRMSQVMSTGRRVVHHANGEFAFDVEPTETILISAEATDGATGSAEPYKLSAGELQTDVRIVVAGLGTVRGRLVRKDNGAPLLGHKVWFPMIGTAGMAPVDGEGRFEMRVPSGAYDHINIQSESMGYPDIPAKFTVEPGRTADLGTLVIEPR